MHSPPFSPKLRVLVLALALSTFILFCYLRSASWEQTHDLKQGAPITPPTPLPPADLAPQSDGVRDSGSALLFDHSFPPIPNIGRPANDITSIIPSTAPSLPPSTNNLSTPAQKKKRRAIVTAIWDYSYASMALMLAHSIKQHNDLEALDAELVLLTLVPDDEHLTGLTTWNKTILREKGGWKIRSEPSLDVKGVNMTQIKAHRRLNLNKLRIFGWSEYERVIFIDADCIVKGSIEEVFKLPEEVEFAAAPDGWPLVEIDSKFNSGFMFFTPSQSLFDDMISKLSNPKFHDPNEGDQQFLQNYWKFRDYRLPPKFNLNLVHHVWRKVDYWDKVFPDARVIHFTTRKPQEWWHYGWCENPITKPPKIGPGECAHIEVLKWYKKEFEQMRRDLKLENEIGILG